MCNYLQNGAVLEVYVHLPEEEYGATFNKVGTTKNRASENIEYNEVGDDAFNGVDVSLNTTSNIPSTSNPTAPNIDPSDSEDSEYSVKGSDESRESDDYEDSELLEDDQYGSDVHEELIQLRAEKRSFLRRRKKRERIPADTEEVPCGNTGADLRFDETVINTNTLGRRLGGDEPYYASSDACSSETDTDDSCLEEGEKMRLKLPNTKRKKYTTDSVGFDPNSKKIVWQLGMVFESVKEFRLAVTKYAIQRRVQIEKCVNEPTRVRVRCCKVNCKWLLYASLDRKTNNFVIKTYMPIHLCQKASRNYLCSSKFIGSVFKDKVIKQLNIRVFKLQELIRNKYNVHVGKTIAKRARAKILNEIMGDHVKEFGRILDYKDESLRSNPGSTCVVKLGEANEYGRVVFEAFYICFAALKMAFMSARKYIGLDGCFLKGTLGLGNGTSFTIMSDMQKGLDIAIKELLPACEERRHKTIISMLEEIRIKVMTRLTRLSEFSNSWITNFSPMSMKVLEENIDKSMTCNIEFNGVTRYEVLDGYKQHIVCLRKRECSCRYWMLKGIPCAHALVAMLHRQYDPHDFIHPCYSKKRYLMTYSHFIQPMNNMPMWPESRNPFVAPPVIKKMSVRPRKLRRKEAGETKVSGKLSKTGLTMTCSLYHVKGHNKRSCHLRRSDEVGSIAGEHRATLTSNVEEPSSSRKGRGRGRPKRSTNIESEPIAKRGRDRPKSASKSASASASASKVAPRTTAPPTTSRTPRHETSASASASRAAPRTTAPPTTSRTLTHEASASVSGVGVSSRTWSSRERGRGLGSTPRGINHPLESWFTCSQGSTTQGVHQNTNVAPKETATARKGKGVGNTTQFKSPRVTGMGVFQAENGFKTFNPGLPSSRILVGPKRVLRSNVVTGDVGFKPTSGLKWKGNQAITTRRLQQIRDQSRL
ncbi:hypothetical protein MTR67_033860 [Solanum verrucosum]|uniref:SWIM-type domain-containing protein n=1 Tax=Solanum verrucosum TaxID=315347 RepID=A0AAF0ZJQ7_SOLVR|nr:hypothetical protein MTR67_033860 [Solanum verrucosum]